MSTLCLAAEHHAWTVAMTTRLPASMSSTLSAMSYHTAEAPHGEVMAGEYPVVADWGSSSSGWAYHKGAASPLAGLKRPRSATFLRVAQTVSSAAASPKSRVRAAPPMLPPRPRRVVIPDPTFVPRRTASLFDCGAPAATPAPRRAPAHGVATRRDSRRSVVPDPSYVPRKTASVYDCGTESVALHKSAVVPDPTFVPTSSANVFDCGAPRTQPVLAQRTAPHASRGASIYDV